MDRRDTSEQDWQSDEMTARESGQDSDTMSGRKTTESHGHEFEQEMEGKEKRQRKEEMEKESESSEQDY